MKETIYIPVKASDEVPVKVEYSPTNYTLKKLGFIFYECDSYMGDWWCLKMPMNRVLRRYEIIYYPKHNAWYLEGMEIKPKNNNNLKELIKCLPF